MTATDHPTRHQLRSIAVVWPPDADAWRTYRQLRQQLEDSGISVHLVARDQLLDIEHGGCDIDAIATIGGALDAARRIAARRGIPYFMLDRCPTDASKALAESEHTSTPVLDVTVDDHLPLIALRSITISTAGGADHGELTLHPSSARHRASWRHQCRQPAVLYVDRRAIHLGPDAVVTVQHGSSPLREHRI